MMEPNLKMYFHIWFLDSKDLLDDIKTQISQFGKDFPLSVLNNASLILDQLQTEIDNVTPEVERIENIR